MGGRWIGDGGKLEEHYSANVLLLDEVMTRNDTMYDTPIFPSTLEFHARVASIIEVDRYVHSCLLIASNMVLVPFARLRIDCRAIPTTPLYYMDKVESMGV